MFNKVAEEIADDVDAEILNAVQQHSYRRIVIKVVGRGCAQDLRLIYDADPFMPLGPQIEMAIRRAKTEKQYDHIMLAADENSSYQGVVERNW